MRLAETIRTAGIALVTAFALHTLAASAEAGPIRARQRNQGKRIAEGAASGELTRKEGRGLGRAEKRLQDGIRCARSDGDVSGREHRRINRAQNRLSRQIYRQKHDRQDRNRGGSVTPGPAVEPPVSTGSGDAAE